MALWFKEFCFLSATLAALGLLGGFVLLPFRGALRYGLLAAPLAGLLTLAPGVAALYSITGWPLAACAALVGAAGSLATVIGACVVRPRVRGPDLVHAFIAFTATAAVATVLFEATTIHRGSPALLYMDGTDHVAYAQMADWLSTHSVSQLPVYSPSAPYQAFPNWMFRADPRFGSLFFLAIVTAVRGLPGVFVYDIACAVVLSAGMLGAAGAFARTPLALLILLGGLTASHWYDYGQGGFFGKLIAYPAVLMIGGLFGADSGDIRSPVKLAALTLLTAGAALMHSGTATALFLACIGGGLLLCRLFNTQATPLPRRLKTVGPGAASLFMLMGVAICATGVLARPLHVSYPDWNFGWGYVLPRLFDLENQSNALTQWGPRTLWIITGLAAALSAGIAAGAMQLRDSAAAGLIVGPMILLIALLIVGGRAAAFQTIGTFYPFSVCAVALLIGKVPASRAQRVAIVLLAIGCIGLRLPRFAGATRRYVSKSVSPGDQYSKREIDRLVARIGNQPVQVDIAGINQAYFLFVELGRRGVPLQWSPVTWNLVVGNDTGWPAPAYASPARLRLLTPQPRSASRLVLARTSQYELIDAGESAAAR